MQAYGTEDQMKDSANGKITLAHGRNLPSQKIPTSYTSAPRKTKTSTSCDQNAPKSETIQPNAIAYLFCLLWSLTTGRPPSPASTLIPAIANCPLILAIVRNQSQVSGQDASLTTSAHPNDRTHGIKHTKQWKPPRISRLQTLQKHNECPSHRMR